MELLVVINEDDLNDNEKDIFNNIKNKILN